MSGEKALAVDLKARGKSPAKFAVDAAAVLKKDARVELESSTTGLVLRGVWEFDVELAIEDLKWSLDLDIECGPPRILYREDPRPLEPVMRVRLKVPEDSVGNVVGDLTLRRGSIEDMNSGDEGLCRSNVLCRLQICSDISMPCSG